METPKPKPRRTCDRQGCDRGVRAGHDCCCFLCDVVNQELERAQRVCEASGESATAIATTLRVSRATVYRVIRMTPSRHHPQPTGAARMVCQAGATVLLSTYPLLVKPPGRVGRRGGGRRRRSVR